jgi:aldehyde dehydrogenase (NAD+)
MGPLVSERQRSRVEEYVGVATAEGAILATGGGRPAHLDRGYYVEPTVFGNVGPDSRLAQEEVFGPVLAVIAADDDDHAVEIANNSIYGLNGAVFTPDVDRAYSIASRLRTGTVGHNAFRSDFTMGFGGFKQSGVGREGGVQGLAAYLESKSVILDGAPSRL